MGSEEDLPAADTTDARRRTWLAAERTWLAWWRTGLGAATASIAVGRLLPSLTHGARWPFRVIGMGYGVPAVATPLAGALRQRRTAEALRRGTYDELWSPLVVWLTLAAVLLSVATVALIVVRF